MAITTIKTWKIEASLRFASALLFILTAVLIGSATETKILFHAVKKKASFRDIDALYTALWMDVVGAAYCVIQLARIYKWSGSGKELEGSSRYTAWAIYLFDQTATYILFAVNLAAVQAAFIALIGAKAFMWLKLCTAYTGFCIKIGHAVSIGVSGAVLMGITSCISAYSLFRLYSAKRILMLKHRNGGQLDH